MKKWPLAWAGAGLTLAWLTRRFSSPALPDPGPLPASVPIPHAEPPEDMALIAVPTGVNNRLAKYAYRGGSVFDRRDFYVGAALIKHPEGDLLSTPASAGTSPASSPPCRAISGTKSIRQAAALIPKAITVTAAACRRPAPNAPAASGELTADQTRQGSGWLCIRSHPNIRSRELQ